MSYVVSGAGFSRVPPHSLEAEESILGGVLLDNDAFDRIGDAVRAEDFYVERHARIFSAVQSLSDQAMPMDALLSKCSFSDSGPEP